jgi:AcrR family transcriptional regulator
MTTGPTPVHDQDTEDARPSSPRREVTRRRVLDAARRVFAEQGLAGASVDDVAHAAGFTKGAVYSNFRTKEELFFAVFADMNDLMIAAAEQVIAEAPEDTDDPHRIIAGVIERFAPLDREWALINAEFRLYSLRNPAAVTPMAEHTRQTQERLRAMFAVALDRLGREPVVPIPTLVAMIVPVYVDAASAVPAITSEGTAGADPEVLPAMLFALSRPRGEVAPA